MKVKVKDGISLNYNSLKNRARLSVNSAVHNVSYFWWLKIS